MSSAVARSYHELAKRFVAFRVARCQLVEMAAASSSRGSNSLLFGRVSSGCSSGSAATGATEAASIGRPDPPARTARGGHRPRCGAPSLRVSAEEPQGVPIVGEVLTASERDRARDHIRLRRRSARQERRLRVLHCADDLERLLLLRGRPPATCGRSDCPLGPAASPERWQCSCCVCDRPDRPADSRRAVMPRRESGGARARSVRGQQGWREVYVVEMRRRKKGADDATHTLGG